MASPRMLTVSEMREIWGAKGDQMTDADLEAIARRLYAHARVILDALNSAKAK